MVCVLLIGCTGCSLAVIRVYNWESPDHHDRMEDIVFSSYVNKDVHDFLDVNDIFISFANACLIETIFVY